MVLDKNQSKKILCVAQIVMSLIFLLIGLIVSIKYMKADFLGVRLITMGMSFVVTGIIGGAAGYLMSDNHPKKYAIIVECFAVLMTIILIITSIRIVVKVSKVTEKSFQLASIERNFVCCGWNHYYDCNAQVPRGKTCYKAVGVGLKSLGYISIIFLVVMVLMESLLFGLYWNFKKTKEHLDDSNTSSLLPNDADDLAPF
ncbi:hypothetical protein EIN_328370 [Entamoeba invadens IP1]|uniref:Tetraspanin family protein n=1 Tax=Entamoeba invadens IP1 TaxID=370355 RepID=A0A0A1TXR7_ENTIV|nr:hypothetical protein EIN_328370 [Entamoeba invadens IP1]ELP86160.1 hypothetical protein EIN_328370 [Entamoeba invadens IP1]|eukprot:XP_004185506.1 hypothetical protein EIN_328370 [Entamoeba invadens IP1]